MVEEVERRLLEIKSLRTVVEEELIVRPELLSVVRVAEVERKLFAVVSPEKETVPLIVANVAELVRKAVDETSPVPKIRNIVDELTWKLMKSPL